MTASTHHAPSNPLFCNLFTNSIGTKLPTRWLSYRLTRHFTISGFSDVKDPLILCMAGNNVWDAWQFIELTKAVPEVTKRFRYRARALGRKLYQWIFVDVTHASARHLFGTRPPRSASNPGSPPCQLEEIVCRPRMEPLGLSKSVWIYLRTTKVSAPY